MAVEKKAAEKMVGKKRPIEKRSKEKIENIIT